MHKAKQYIGYLLNVIVATACIYFLYKTYQEKPIQIQDIWEKLTVLPIYITPIFIFLSLGSWAVESYKWQYLVRDFWQLRFRESVISNLTSQAASFVTPFRTGEYLYKSLYFPKDYRKLVLSRVMVGNVCQMAVTTSLGFIGISHFLNEIENKYYIFIAAIVFITLPMMALWYFSKKYDLKKVMFSDIFVITSLSLIRYLLFSQVWMLLFYMLLPDFDYLDLYSRLVIFYLIISIVPILQLFDIALKWGTATFLFTLKMDIDESIILLITTITWLVNTILPTLLGMLLLVFNRVHIKDS